VRSHKFPSEANWDFKAADDDIVLHCIRVHWVAVLCHAVLCCAVLPSAYVSFHALFRRRCVYIDGSVGLALGHPDAQASVPKAVF